MQYQYASNQLSTSSFTPALETQERIFIGESLKEPRWPHRLIKKKKKKKHKLHVCPSLCFCETGFSFDASTSSVCISAKEPDSLAATTDGEDRNSLARVSQNFGSTRNSVCAHVTAEWRGPQPAPPVSSARSHRVSMVIRLF